MGSFAWKISKVCWVAATVSPFASAQVPQSAGDIEAILQPAGDLLEGALGGAAGNILERRQDAASTNDTDLAIWDTETSALCEKHLSQLSVATNPSGTAICYNLPSLDTTTGAFMADLRLYQVSTPSGDFSGISPEEIQVGVQYDGASVSPINQTINARSVEEALKKRQTITPTLLQSYMMVGQVDMSRMPSPLTIGGVEALVMPQVTLSAREATATVSPNEAAFINGVFSRDVVMSDFGLAQLAVDNITAQYQNGTVAFIVPGVNILIFPIGLIITAIWTVVGFAAYGFGTYERYAYRDAYRRRKNREMKGSTGRI
ncbi:hypothetical protein MGN70_002703 [Eutypa lata]|nr:hypothetical protein MGN70_002703 [Eutypa lata]